MLSERVLEAATGGVALRLRLGLGAVPAGLSEEGMLGLAACLRARVLLGCGLIPRHQQGLRGAYLWAGQCAAAHWHRLGLLGSPIIGSSQVMLQDVDGSCPGLQASGAMSAAVLPLSPAPSAPKKQARKAHDWWACCQDDHAQLISGEEAGSRATAPQDISSLHVA